MKASTTIAAVAALAVAASAAAQTALDTKRIIATGLTYPTCIVSAPGDATRLFVLEKAGRIIFAQRPPSRISEDPAWYECRMCAHHDVCHGGGAAAVNCRTCLHATPVEGGWHCARHDRMQASQEQRGACERHLFIPDLVPGEVTDAGDDHVTYRMKDGTSWINDARGTEVASC